MRGLIVGEVAEGGFAPQSRSFSIGTGRPESGRTRNVMGNGRLRPTSGHSDRSARRSKAVIPTPRRRTLGYQRGAGKEGFRTRAALRVHQNPILIRTEALPSRVLLPAAPSRTTPRRTSLLARASMPTPSVPSTGAVRAPSTMKARVPMSAPEKRRLPSCGRRAVQGKTAQGNGFISSCERPYKPSRSSLCGIS